MGASKMSASTVKYVDHTYHDYSRYVQDGGELVKHKKSGNNFPAKLHQVLSEPKNWNVITWMPHGRAWKVLDREDLIKNVIPNYFVCSKFESFTRQLNGWGFKRMYQSGADCGCFYHECFLRDLPKLTCMIRRVPANLGKSTPYAAGEPNFYSISELYPVPPINSKSSSQTIVGPPPPPNQTQFAEPATPATTGRDRSYSGSAVSTNFDISDQTQVLLQSASFTDPSHNKRKIPPCQLDRSLSYDTSQHQRQRILPHNLSRSQSYDPRFAYSGPHPEHARGSSEHNPVGPLGLSGYPYQPSPESESAALEYTGSRASPYPYPPTYQYHLPPDGELPRYRYPPPPPAMYYDPRAAPPPPNSGEDFYSSQQAVNNAQVDTTPNDPFAPIPYYSPTQRTGVKQLEDAPLANEAQPLPPTDDEQLGTTTASNPTNLGPADRLLQESSVKQDSNESIPSFSHSTLQDSVKGVSMTESATNETVRMKSDEDNISIPSFSHSSSNENDVKSREISAEEKLAWQGGVGMFE